MKVFTDVRHARTKQIATQDHGANPKYAAENIKKQITRIRHARSARDGRAKCANNGDETRQNYGSSAVLFVELVRALQMASAKQKRVFPFVKSGASAAANPVSQLVAKNGAQDAGKQQPLNRHNILSSKNSGSDQERIARQEEANKQAGLDKKNAANDSAKCQGPNPLDELFQAFSGVERAEKVKDGIQRRSAASRLLRTKRKCSPPGSEPTAPRSW